MEMEGQKEVADRFLNCVCVCVHVSTYIDMQITLKSITPLQKQRWLNVGTPHSTETIAVSL